MIIMLPKDTCPLIGFKLGHTFYDALKVLDYSSSIVLRMSCSSHGVTSREICVFCTQEISLPKVHGFNLADYKNF